MVTGKEKGSVLLGVCWLKPRRERKGGGENKGCGGQQVGVKTGS